MSELHRPLELLRKCELKTCPRTLVHGCPQPPAVILYNGPADRQPHAHTLALGGVKGDKNLFPDPWVKSGARVLHDDDYLIVLTYLRSDDQLSWPILNGTHRFNPVHDQVKHYLLELHSVTQYRWESSCQICAQGDSPCPQFTLCECKDLFNGLIYVQSLPLNATFPAESANLCNHLARPLAVPNDAPDSLASSLDVG